MGASRRLRGRNGATFLELVKDALDELRTEIASLKTLIVGDGESILLPPPAPPHLDTYDRNFLLLFREANLEPKEPYDIMIKTTTDFADLHPPGFAKTSWNVEASDFTPLELQLPHVMLGSNLGKDVWYPYELPVPDLADTTEASVSNTLDSAIARAQQEAGKLREAEKECARITSEAAEMEARLAMDLPVEVPSTMTDETMANFFFANLQVAREAFKDEHRRAYMQQQIARLESKFCINDEIGAIIDGILQQYVPLPDLGKEWKYMCSHCGAPYKTSTAQCEVCKGYDVFDASAYDQTPDETLSSESSQCLDGDSSPGAFCLNRKPQELLVKQWSFPSFMKRETQSKDPLPYTACGTGQDSSSHCYYAVRGGEHPGIYLDWNTAREHASGGLMKKFYDKDDALDFINCIGLGNE